MRDSTSEGPQRLHALGLMQLHFQRASIGFAPDPRRNVVHSAEEVGAAPALVHERSYRGFAVPLTRLVR